MTFSYSVYFFFVKGDSLFWDQMSRSLKVGCWEIPHNTELKHQKIKKNFFFKGSGYNAPQSGS